MKASTIIMKISLGFMFIGVNVWMLGDRIVTAQDRNRPVQLYAQQGHSGMVTCVALSSDGQFLVTGGRDGTARLWEVETGRELHSFNGNSRPITSVALSRDGKYLAAGNGTVWVWETDTKHEGRRFAGSSVSFSPDGKYVITTSGRIARLWEVESGNEVRMFEGHSDIVTSVAFSPEGKQVATGSRDNTARLWEVETGRELRRLEGHSAEVLTVALSSNGKYLVTGARDGTARLWEIETGRELRRFQNSGRNVVVALSGNGRFLVTGSTDGTARLWESDSGRELRPFAMHSHEVTSLALNDNGQLLVTGGDEGRARLWRTKDMNELHRFEGDSGTVIATTLSNNGRYLVIGESSGVARLWDIENGRELRSFEEPAKSLSSVAVSGDGQRLVMGGSDGVARLWDIESGQELRRFEGHTGPVILVKLSIDERYLVTRDYFGTLWFWDVAAGRELRHFGGDSPSINIIALSNDGQFMVTAGRENVARLWDVKTGQELRKFEGHTGSISSIVLSNDGHYLVTGGLDKTVRLWDVATGRELRRIGENLSSIGLLLLSLDGRYLATSGLPGDNKVRLLEMETGRELSRFEGHYADINSMAFMADGQSLITGSKDSTFRIWNLATGKEKCRLISFHNSSWAVIDSEGRFDSSNGGNIEGLHWVVGNESISVNQLKNRYYEPGLMASTIKGATLRQVDNLKYVKLFPQTNYEAPTANSTQLHLTLTNRGGGIGKVRVLVNGKEIVADARPNNFNPNAPQAELRVDLSAAPLQTGAPNRIEVVAWNVEDYLSSRVVTREWNADVLLASRGVKSLNAGAATATTKAPELYAIVGGVSQYASDSLNLRYAAKDAEDMAQALQLGAQRLFGTDKVHLTLLSSTGHPGTIAATKENFKKAFAFARRAKSEDVLVIYLAGHGIAMRLTGDDDLYCYLTQEARRIELSDPAVREASSITSEEMVDWIKQIPALKQVMVLDTCAAGAALGKLTESRNLSGEQIRAIDRLKDRTGFHVLMGAAADKVSYEATQYSQGLLTYALLEGMKGAALRSDDIVDDVKLFQYAANRVPELARAIKLGGIQEPRIAAPKGAEGFYIGQMKLADKTAISLAKSRPLILRPNFIDPQERFDTLELTTLVRQKLDLASYAASRGQTETAGVVYVDADELPTAYLPVGTYRIEGNEVTITVDLRQDKKRIASFEVSGAKDKAADLAAEIVRQITQALQKQ